MKKHNVRANQILSILNDRQMATTSELATLCGVSDVTIRRDLLIMSQERLVTVVHGAVSLNIETAKLKMSDKYFITQQAERNKREKQAISDAAMALIEPNDTIILDVGTTPYFLARAIPPDFPITIICYSLNTFIELHDRTNCNLIFAGGYFHQNSLICESSEGIELIRRLRAQKAFMGATGINDKMGITSSNYNEQRIKQAAIASSLHRILLADSTKFGVVKAAYFADIEDFDTIITDSGVSEEYEKLITGKGVRLIKVQG